MVSPTCPGLDISHVHRGETGRGDFYLWGWGICFGVFLFLIFFFSFKDKKNLSWVTSFSLTQ